MRKKLQFFPTCGSPDKTLSFRATTTTTAAATTGVFQEMASTGEPTGEIETSIEPVIRGLSSDRFFFKPGKTSSILDEAKEKEKEKVLEFKESVSMMEMESTDPFVDFKKSMQEMVEADEGLKEWDNLQELLSLYLAVNDKINHGYIIRAFVDLMLVNFGATSSSSCPSSCSSSSSLNVQEESLLREESNKKKIISSKSPESALSFTSSSASSSGTCSSTSNCLSSCSLEGEEEEEEDDNSVQKEVDSDNASSSFSSSKV